ncbi:MAG: Uracil-DNA glycosylase [Polaribacter sp. SA4-10]|nr:MAG: Uracil-DNA glycosylase [Polaribacter sp. SA4-10]
MQVKIADSWKNILQNEFEKPYFKQLTAFVDAEYEKHICFPNKEVIFSAFDFCSFDALKVVIIGQDPYHGEGQANGLCFSVQEGVKHPPSLQNIFKEMSKDLSCELPQTGDLENWAKQGVLLLNATLTVRTKEPGSHQKKGWEIFTDATIAQISQEKENVIFLLWGKFAESKMNLIDLSKHTIFKAPHPSPLGAWRGWFGSKHFTKTNAVLKSLNKVEINW